VPLPINNNQSGVEVDKVILAPPAPLPKKEQKTKSAFDSSKPKKFGILFQDELKFDPKPMVLEMLHHYAEGGDVQTAVVMSLVLGDRITVASQHLRQWFLSYIGKIQ
jgi:hypothetical protein